MSIKHCSYCAGSGVISMTNVRDKITGASLSGVTGTCAVCDGTGWCVEAEQPSGKVAWVPDEGQVERKRANGTLTERDHDPVNHPRHYTGHPSGVECITITRHMTFNLGNVVKYIWRADGKGAPLEDLKKAAWYLNDEIQRRTMLEADDTLARITKGIAERQHGAGNGPKPEHPTSGPPDYKTPGDLIREHDQKIRERHGVKMDPTQEI